MKEKKLRNNKVVVFPGTIKRLKAQAHSAAEVYAYDAAVEQFEQLLQYEMLEEHSLRIYAFALFEIRRFETCKEVCEQLFTLGTDLYIEVMELYLSACMELREFQHVEAMIAQLFSEEIIPEQSIDSFEHLRALNERLAQSADEKALVEQLSASTVPEQYELEPFFAQPLLKQLQALRVLQQLNVRPFSTQLQNIIEDERAHPMIQSIALYVLVEQQVALQITVTKFGRTKVMDTTQLVLPENMEIVTRVLEIVENQLQQEVATFDMVQYLITRHLLVTYPFAWFDYHAEEVAEGYIAYVHKMFGQIEESDYDLLELLDTLEKFSELPEA